MPTESGKAVIKIRPMQQADIPELLRMMRALVAFERGEGFLLDEAELVRRGFGAQPEFGAFMADAGHGAIVGMAVYYEIPYAFLEAIADAQVVVC